MDDLSTPCLLLDRAKLQNNLVSMASRLRRLGVPLRLHVKTCKNAEIAKLAVAGQPGGITVSTLAEAEYFARYGFHDQLYAVGIAPGKLQRVTGLRASAVGLVIALDHPDTARAVIGAQKDAKRRFRVLLEIDTDGERAGFRHDDETLLSTARALERGGCDVLGVMTHAGGSYHCRSTACIEDIAENERVGAVEAVTVLREADMEAPVVSVGSTPTARYALDLDGVTEVRAGVYMFQDLVMAGLGVCEIDDIAISVLCEVIGHRSRQGQVVVDAGWMALSRDRGTADQEVDQGYGLVCDDEGNVLDDIVVTATSQEHGTLARRDGEPLDTGEFPVGRRLRILPNHACATAAQHDRYHLLDDHGEVIRELERCRGW